MCEWLLQFYFFKPMALAVRASVFMLLLLIIYIIDETVNRDNTLKSRYTSLVMFLTYLRPLLPRNISLFLIL